MNAKVKLLESILSQNLDRNQCKPFQSRREISKIPCPQSYMSTDEDKSSYNSVGLLRVNWYNDRGDLVTINYGTAFAVAPQLIITCSHNLFSQKRNMLCSQVIFIPGIVNQTIGNSVLKHYRATKYFNFRYSKPITSFSSKPTNEELSMILLDEQLSNVPFLPVGQISNDSKNVELELIGYPSEMFRDNPSLNKVKPMRKGLKGKLYSLEPSTIHHTMSTQVGHSGSPIMAKNSQGQLYAVGIHTHRGLGSYYNSGVYFSDINLQTIKQYQEELTRYAKRQKTCQISYITKASPSKPLDLEGPTRLSFFEQMRAEFDNLDEIHPLQFKTQKDEDTLSFQSDMDEELRQWFQQENEKEICQRAGKVGIEGHYVNDI